MVPFKLGVHLTLPLVLQFDFHYCHLLLMMKYRQTEITYLSNDARFPPTAFQEKVCQNTTPYLRHFSFLPSKSGSGVYH